MVKLDAIAVESVESAARVARLQWHDPVSGELRESSAEQIEAFIDRGGVVLAGDRTVRPVLVGERVSLLTGHEASPGVDFIYTLPRFSPGVED